MKCLLHRWNMPTSFNARSWASDWGRDLQHIDAFAAVGEMPQIMLYILRKTDKVIFL